MKLINFGGTILWGNSLINKFVFYLVSLLLFAGLMCCENQSRIDTWKYQKGPIEQVVNDTIQGSKKFNNPYLSDIIFIDSIMSKSISTASNDTSIQIGDLIIGRTVSIEVKIDTKNYSLFRGDISGGDLHQNLNFIYEEDLGVIAYYVYGHGYVKLVSRKQGSKSINVNQSVYEKMIESDILFPVQMPDTLEIYDFSIQGSIE